MFLLYVTSQITGVVQLLTFPTSFDRALVMITLSAQPVTLSFLDYTS
jgi:hypothetical protein